MQKLLIVIAIQFCLPLGAAVLQKELPIHMGLILSTSTVIIQTVCLGCALGLLWPRWFWMFVTCFLTIVYWSIWYADFRYHVQDLPVDLVVWYGKVMLSTALLACTFTLLLMFRRTIVWRQAGSLDATHSMLRFSMRDLLYFTGILGLVAGLLSAMYHESKFDLLGDYFAPRDLWAVTWTMLLFYHLLQRSIPWLSLFLCSVSMFLIWLAINPIAEGYTAANYHGVYIFDAISCVLSMVTVLLYRWSGFRIVPRCELAQNSQPPGPLPCKNC